MKGENMAMLDKKSFGKGKKTVKPVKKAAPKAMKKTKKCK
jgi:hypothetical protein